MPGHFITKYGDRIDFIDGYFDLFPDLVAQYRDVIQIYDDFSAYLEQQGQSRGNTPPVQGAAYLARHARTANMIHMLERFDVSRQFRSVLDIGTGYGIMPRLMKAYGIAERAYGLDLTDRTHFVSSEQILAYERDLETTRRVDALEARLNRYLPFRFEPTGWPRKASHPEFGFVMNDASSRSGRTDPRFASTPSSSRDRAARSTRTGRTRPCGRRWRTRSARRPPGRVRCSATAFWRRSRRRFRLRRRRGSRSSLDADSPLAREAPARGCDGG